MSAGGCFQAVTRKKTFSGDSVGKSELARCMTLTDLTMLGVGSTLGLGVYVLAGSVAKYLAGPAVVLSFLVAAGASAIAGICYAEFACRVPRAGSAYVYSYVTVGELIAFVIGWNLILEYIIGGASVARGLVGYVDAQFGDVLGNYMREVMPMNVSFLSPHPDFVAFLIMMLLAALLSSGVKESTVMNNIFTVVNIVTILIVITAGSMKADIANWRITKEAIPEGVDGGEGGFMPFGIGGVMAGAAQCFYGFVGFDAVATTGEEAKNPQRNIPLAIVISLTIIFFAYFGISVVLTMMWPYFDQNPIAPLPHVFTMVGWPVVTWIVTVGAVFALCTSMLGAMFPLPRVLYAMANDGLLFKSLAKIHPKTQTPIVATVLSGVVAGVMAMIFDLQQLIEMLSIGTLLAYTIVSICVLVLRYEDEDLDSVNYPGLYAQPSSSDSGFVPTRFLDDIFNLSMKKYPSVHTSRVSKWAITAFCILSVGICLVLSQGIHALVEGKLWIIIISAILVSATLITLLIIGRQPCTTMELTFKVPLVPILPALSIIINTYLMMMLEVNTWIRFTVWMALGFLIYFLYSIRNSEQGKRMAVMSVNSKVSPPTSALTIPRAATTKL